MGSAVVAPLGDLGRYIVEFAFGDIYSREGLALRERELVTVAMLTVLDRGPELRVHLGAALNVGATPEELEEVIIQTLPYAGFPTAIHAVKALRDVVTERPVDPGGAAVVASAK